MVPVSEQKYCTLENSAEDEGTKKDKEKLGKPGCLEGNKKPFLRNSKRKQN